MAFCDFVIKYDPAKDTKEDIAKRILYSIFVKRWKANKPSTTFLGGDSGEGKSESVLRLFEILFEIQGLDIMDFLDDVNVYTPIEYPQKVDALLNDKRLKKANLLAVHEARELVKAKLWHSFLTQAIADVNSMSRVMKRIGFFIVSQFIRDITRDMRYTLNFYFTVKRPKTKRARLYMSVIWKDDRDLEKPKLRKRKLSGYLVYPDGVYRRYVPKYFELSRPRKEVREHFQKKDLESKRGIIKKKLDRLIKEMSIDLEDGNDKITAMVKFYSENTESLRLIGRRQGKKWRFHPQVKDMHDLNDMEYKEFGKQLNAVLKEKGVIQKNPDEEEL